MQLYHTFTRRIKSCMKWLDVGIASLQQEGFLRTVYVVCSKNISVKIQKLYIMCFTFFTFHKKLVFIHKLQYKCTRYYKYAMHFQSYYVEGTLYCDVNAESRLESFH